MNEHQAFYKEATHKIRSLRRQIGENIHIIRKQRKIPLKKLSRLSQLNADIIDQLEIGKGELNLMHLIRLAIALKVDVTMLLSLESLTQSASNKQYDCSRLTGL